MPARSLHTTRLRGVRQPPSAALRGCSRSRLRMKSTGIGRAASHCSPRGRSCRVQQTIPSSRRTKHLFGEVLDVIRLGHDLRRISALGLRGPAVPSSRFSRARLRRRFFGLPVSALPSEQHHAVEHFWMAFRKASAIAPPIEDPRACMFRSPASEPVAAVRQGTHLARIYWRCRGRAG